MVVQDPLTTHIPEDAPEFLYHYSNAAGLLGILKDKKIWLTHATFLNDSEEYSYGINLIKQVITEEYGPQLVSDQRLNMSANIFCLSLTEEGDLLSQWRGYCPNGGYAFAFDKAQLNQLLQPPAPPTAPKMYIGKCIYDLEEQKEFIRKNIVGSNWEEWQTVATRIEVTNKVFRIKHLLRQAEYDRRDHSEEEQQEIQDLRSQIAGREHLAAPEQNGVWKPQVRILDNIFWSVLRYVGLLKHPAFKEEKEWRIIYNNNRVNLHDENTEFREGRSTIIPYIKYPLATGEDPVRITKVIVSPGPQPELAKMACEALLFKNQKYIPYKVINSIIPYRSW